MIRNIAILLVLAVLVALPFVFRREDGAAVAAGDDAVRLVIVTPHNEAIRYEFERGFAAWHKARFGKAVRIDWRSIGGTSEIARYLSSEYTAAAKAWWTAERKKTWPAGATVSLTSSRPPADAGELEVYSEFRKPESDVTVRIDLFFGGGQFDHENAVRQGFIVPPWDAKNPPPPGIFRTESGEELIPRSQSGEIWWTDNYFGAVVSTFGICYNHDRLREIGLQPPKTWDDLADPACTGKLGAADPDKSGSVAKAFEMMIHQKVYEEVRAAGHRDAEIDEFERRIDAYRKQRGKDYRLGDIPPEVPAKYQEAIEQGWVSGIRLVQHIGANARYFTDSAGKVPIDVSKGDAAVGMAIDFYARFQAEMSRSPDGAERMTYLTPAGGSSVSCDPISLLRGAGGHATTAEQRKEVREVAVRFIQYVLSEDGQKLWTYRPGEPGGPQKYALRRLPIRRDFYPSANPSFNASAAQHAKHAADKLDDPAINPYALAQQFQYRPRWTGSHFSVQRRLIRVMCLDSGEELRAAWKAIHSGLGRSSRVYAYMAMEKLPTVLLTDRKSGQLVEVPLNWRTAPTIFSTYEPQEVMREWTKAFQANYVQARQIAEGTAR